jgi:hypothetical protein
LSLFNFPTPATPITTAFTLAFASPSPAKGSEVWAPQPEPQMEFLHSGNSNSFLSPFKNTTSTAAWPPADDGDSRGRSDFFVSQHHDYSNHADPFVLENANSNRSATGFLASIFASK